MQEREHTEMLDLTETGLTKRIQTSFDLLNLHCFFQLEKEVRASTISEAQQRLRPPKRFTVIFKRLYQSEVISYDDFIEFYREVGAKEMENFEQKERNIL